MDVGVPSSFSWLAQLQAFSLCHHRLRSLTPFCKFTVVPLTDMLDNHTGVMPASVRTIVSTPLHPHQDSNSRPNHWHEPNTTVIDLGHVWSPHRQVGEFYQVHLWQWVNIIELNAAANPQFRRGSMTDSPCTSRLSLSFNSRVTVMSSKTDKKFLNRLLHVDKIFTYLITNWGHFVWGLWNVWRI